MNKHTSLKSKRGFTLVEIIIVVVLLGLLINTGVNYMRDTSVTGRTNVMATNANEMNKAVQNITAATGSITQGTYAFTAGSATAPAVIVLPNPATAAAVASFLGQLSGTGVVSMGNTATLAKAVTAASYTYTWTNGLPVFSVVSGAVTP